MKTHWTQRLQQMYRQVRQQSPQIHLKHFHNERKQEWFRELQETSFALPSNLQTLQDSSLHWIGSLENLQLEIALTAPPTPYDVYQWKRLIHRAITLIHLYNIKKSIHVWVIPDPALRTMPSPGISIKPHNINGGYTYIRDGGQQIQIVITRQEEWNKVLLHEVLHHAKVDGDIAWSQRGLQELYDLWNISYDGCPSMAMNQCNTRLHPHEGIVEFWAEVYQTHFLHMDYGIPIDILYQKERAHVWNASLRLLHHQKTLKSREWSEESHAYSYIILRGMLWTFLEELPDLNDETKLLAFLKEKWGTYQDMLTPCKSDVASLRMTHVLGDF